MMIIVWIILAGIAAWFVKYAIDHKIFNIHKANTKDRAFETLEKQYMHGEINKREYEDEIRNLSNSK